MASQLRNEVIFREDLRSLLMALGQTNQVLGRLENQQVALYQQGFSAALEAVATAYDVHLQPQPSIKLEVRHQLSSGYYNE